MESSEAAQTLAGSLAGEPDAERRLIEIVYDDLRAIAVARLKRERAAHTLQPTALVHEAYLRLIGQNDADIQSRTHFMAIAATTMRRVLVDHARARKADKRGGGERVRALTEGHAARWQDPSEVLEFDDALVRLARSQPRQARVAELHFFGGLTLAEIAVSLAVSRDTVKLDWRFAKAWLASELTDVRER